MPITTYTELEISLQTRITELLKETNVWSVEYSLVKAENIRLMANSLTIQRQLAEAQALIEASRNQDAAMGGAV